MGLEFFAELVDVGLDLGQDVLLHMVGERPHLLGALGVVVVGQFIRNRRNQPKLSGAFPSPAGAGLSSRRAIVERPAGAPGRKDASSPSAVSCRLT